MNNWIEVSEQRLAGNFRAIEQAAGSSTTILAVIKANAYGHGAELCARILARAGARWLGVTSATEGARVREALGSDGLDPEILIMSGFLPWDVPLIDGHRLTPVLWTLDHVAWLAGSPGTRVHVEVDTGMGRQGVTCSGIDALMGAMSSAGLVLDGLFTHFCSSEVAAAPMTELQRQRFSQVVERVKASAQRPTWIHAANTSAVDNPPPAPGWLAALAAGLGSRMLARTGLALCGYCLPIEQASPVILPHLRPLLKPVMTWKAHILAVRDLAPGDTVGYNATYTANRPMRVALLPAGYADGLRRELSSRDAEPGGWTLIRNQRAPILGRISMNLTVVDVTGIEGVIAGDEAILLGDGITADDHAALAHTIAYEILCGIHPCS